MSEVGSATKPLLELNVLLREILMGTEAVLEVRKRLHCEVSYDLLEILKIGLGIMIFNLWTMKCHTRSSLDCLIWHLNTCSQICTCKYKLNAVMFIIGSMINRLRMSNLMISKLFLKV